MPAANARETRSRRARSACQGPLPRSPMIEQAPFQMRSIAKLSSRVKRIIPAAAVKAMKTMLHAMAAGDGYAAPATIDQRKPSTIPTMGLSSYKMRQRAGTDDVGYMIGLR